MLFSIELNASPQIPDYLFYEGKMVQLSTYPLEKYLKINGLEEIDRGCNSSSCSRGYIAIWELKNRKLFLKEIKPCGIIAVAGVFTGLECEESQSSEVFKYLTSKFKTKNVLADWYCGELISPQGRQINYLSSVNYSSSFEKEKHFNIKNGILIDTKTIENKVKPELFEFYNRSLIKDTLFYYISKMDWKTLEDKYLCVDEYSVRINKKGKVSKVWYETYFESKWKKFWYNFNDFGCRRRIKESIKYLNFKPYLKGKSKEIDVRLNLDLRDEKLILLN